MNDVLFAQINSNGSVSTWQATTSFTAIRRDFGAVAYNGFMYIMGGQHSASDTSCNPTASARCSDVQYAPIKANGTLGTWAATTSLPAVRNGFGAAAYNGYLYVVGGQAGTYLNTVVYAPIKADGTIGSWQSANSFTGARGALSVTAYNGYIYLFGGYDGTNYHADTQLAQINASGSLGQWFTTTSIATARGNQAAVNGNNGYLYVLGGYPTSGTRLNDVQYAQVAVTNTNSGVTTTTALPSGRYRPDVVVANGYMYVIGGNTDTASTTATTINSVLYAKINSDGTVGSWTTSANTFVGGYGYMDGASVAYNNYLYIIGGRYHTSTSNTVMYASINPSTGVVGTWATTTAFTTSRILNMGWAYNGRLYMAGGFLGTASTACSTISTQYCRDVQMATINSDGTVGTWTTTTMLPGGRAYGVPVVSGNTVYITGGDGLSSGADGSTGSSQEMNWNTMDPSTGALGGTWSGAVKLHRSVRLSAGVYAGIMYTWGGDQGTTNGTSTVDGEYVTLSQLKSNLSGDSGCGSQYCLMTSLPQETDAPGYAVYNGFVYTVGGAGVNTTGGTPYSTVQVSMIGNGGNGGVGAWTSNANTYATGRNNQMTVVNNNYIYIFGGSGSGSSYFNDVQYAPLNPDGSVGTWATTTALPTNVASGGGIAYNGYIYIIGGTNGTTKTATTYYTTFNADGTLGTWQTTSSIIQARQAFLAAAYKGYMYVAGGTSNGAPAGCTGSFCSDVQYAPINSDGTLGAWHYTHNSTDDNTTFVAGFTNGRYHAGVTIYNGYLYVAGGQTSSAVAADVQFAPINSNGTVGAWTTTTALPSVRMYARLTAYNGYMYSVGGYDGTNAFNDVLVAPIYQDGSLGAWSATTVLPYSRYGLGTVVANGYLYSLGGYAGGTFSAAVHYTSMNVIARTATYSKMIDLGTTAAVGSITYNGTAFNVSQPGKLVISYRLAGSDGVFNSAQLTGSVASADCHVSSQLARYVWIIINLNDSATSSFPDSNGSTVTDLTVNYTPAHPTPDIRLRGGKTLQQGSQTALDTCIAS